MPRPDFSAPLAACCALSALIFAACEKPQIRYYTVPKDAPAATPPPAEVPDGHAGHVGHAERPKPQVSYTLPTGWREVGANSMSLVNFEVKTEAGEATVNITPLAGMRGREAAIANMWRAQVGQPALNDAEAAAAFTTVEIAGAPGQLFEVTGASDGKTLRIVTAFAHRGEESWFYKLQGADAVVTAQKPAFIEFLKTVRIKDAAAAPTAGAPTAPTEMTTSGEAPAASATAQAPAPKWTVPEGWETLPPGQMQVAKFAVPAVESAKAEVAVSVFPGDTGGTLANVNRWRRQLGLGDITEAALKDHVTPLEKMPGAELADLTNDNRRMLGAIVPRDGKWWFYKMMGDAPAVNAAREAFVRFAQSPP